MDKGHYLCGKATPFPGGVEYADDVITMYLQGTFHLTSFRKKMKQKSYSYLEMTGSTQYDALGHVWMDDKLWNGYDAKTTVGALSKNSILPIAEKGMCSS